MKKEARVRTFSPVLQEALDAIPQHLKKRRDWSFEISDRIDVLLKRKGMTRKEFARKAGCTENEVSRWLCGTHNFTLATLARISDALGEDIIRVVKTRKQD